MKFKCVVVLAALLVSSRTTQLSAAQFQNLGFEDSLLSGSPQIPATYPASDLFPAWTLRVNEFVLSDGYLNSAPLAGALAALVTSSVPYGGTIEGSRSIYLQGWVTGPMSIGQTGDVPAGTRSLRFAARNSAYRTLPNPPSPLFATMNAQNVPLVMISASGTGDFVFGADVTAWAGTNSELRLGLLNIQTGGTGFAVIDSIGFSPITIPEPTGALTCTVAAMLLRLRMRPNREGA